MILQFILFFLLWCSILGTGYFYIGWRLTRDAHLSRNQKRIAWGIVAGSFVSLQAPFFLLMAGIERSWLDFVFWAGYVSLGMVSVLVPMLFARDIMLGMERLLRFVTSAVRKDKGLSAEETTYRPERRAFLIHSTNLGMIGASALLTGYGIAQAHRRADIENIDIALPHLPPEFDGFRIVQFSDIHVGPTIKRNFVEGVVEQVNGLRPDLIAFTGDLVDGSVAYLRDDVEPFRELRAPHGVYFVTGNHEYYSDAEPWVQEASRLGFRPLINEHDVVERNGARIVLAGVTDFGAAQLLSSHASDPTGALRNAPEGLVRILLAHQPRSIGDADGLAVDLQLSGHTHGGQIVPWNYLVTLNQPYIKGLHQHGSTHVYVNRGTGYWGPPLRIGMPPEITMVTLRRAA